jgi:hypothetical protein
LQERILVSILKKKNTSEDCCRLVARVSNLMKIISFELSFKMGFLKQNYDSNFQPTTLDLTIKAYNISRPITGPRAHSQNNKFPEMEISQFGNPKISWK